jgi:hypothetical protein
MVMDHQIDKFYPRVDPYRWPHRPFETDEQQKERQREMQMDLERLLQKDKPKEPGITPEELKEFRELLERAREYDRRNKEPECEMDSKKKLLKDIAKALGVEIDFI